MFANAALVATVVCLALGFALVHVLGFLVPWRNLIVHHYWKAIAIYASLAFLNVFGLAIWLERKFLLRDAGRKLTHLDQEIHSGHNALSEEVQREFSEPRN